MYAIAVREKKIKRLESINAVLLEACKNTLKVLVTAGRRLNVHDINMIEQAINKAERG